MPESGTSSDGAGEHEATADYICPMCGLEDDVELQMDKHILSAHSLSDRVDHLLAVAGSENSSA